MSISARLGVAGAKATAALGVTMLATAAAGLTRAAAR